MEEDIEFVLTRNYQRAIEVILNNKCVVANFGKANSNSRLVQIWRSGDNQFKIKIGNDIQTFENLNEDEFRKQCNMLIENIKIKYGDISFYLRKKYDFE